MIQDPEIKNNDSKKRNSDQINECKKHIKVPHLKLPTKFPKNNKESSTFCLSDNNEDRYFSSCSEQGKNLLKNTIVNFGLSTISHDKNDRRFSIGNFNFKNNGKIKVMIR